MSHTDRTVDHLAFVEALAALESDTTPEWRRLSAGFLCLRALDRWAGRSCSDSWDASLSPLLANVSRAIGQLDQADPTRRLLTSLLRMLETNPRGQTVTVRPRLMAYARALEHASKWALAIDVYRSVLAHCDGREDRTEAAVASLRVGECHRQCAEWDEAQAAFASAMSYAAADGDLATVLRARCLAAAVTAERGDLPAADVALVVVERDAEAARLWPLLGLALHGRAHVAFQRRDFEAATRHGHAALQHLVDPAAREGALADVAAAFAEMGVRSAARDAHLIIAATAQESYVRWTALINLMELAAMDRLEPVFEHYRRELAGTPLPPRLAGYYHLYAGAGAWTFGRRELARDQCRRALELAQSNGLAQLIFQAEAVIRDIEAAVPAIPALPPAAPTPATAPVAAALIRMRTVANPVAVGA